MKFLWLPATAHTLIFQQLQTQLQFSYSKCRSEFERQNFAAPTGWAWLLGKCCGNVLGCRYLKTECCKSLGKQMEGFDNDEGSAFMSFVQDDCTLEQDRADLSAVLAWVAGEGRSMAVSKLLASGSRCSACYQDSLCLRLAARSGHVTTVDLLLCDDTESRAIPNACNSEALRHAAANGHIRVVQLLLDDNREIRALPDANDSWALQRAAMDGHTSIVIALLSDNRSHRSLPNARDSLALTFAKTRGHFRIVEALLEDERDCRAEEQSSSVSAYKNALFSGY